ncbi:hypothetical protein A9Q84_16085 [Halobacteriovorax marinus]|uniref:Uncharacterized protein n=1 Tax=Halobacteriovorax marinus TaxID=97084 RepID=A0A1Y5F4P3_9BACT|nr:hypothetical protein A9Q84_16085 [Halobacteriovorax marinus]
MSTSAILNITFCNHENRAKTKVLKWNIEQHPAALLWLKLLKNYLIQSQSIHTRFNGFIHGYRDKDFLTLKLNNCIEIINKWDFYKEVIPHLKAEEFSQKYSNIIHHHFEILMGPVEDLSKYYKLADDLTRRAICGLNHYIHDLETIHRAQELGLIDKNSTTAGVVTEFYDARKYIIPEPFLDFFTTDLEFGDLCLHYSQIGKTWLEVFLDGDEEIHIESILPHKYITGEFDIFFGESIYTKDDKEKLKNFLNNYGKDIADPKLALGYMPVAKLIRETKQSQYEFVKEMSHYMAISNIEILVEDKSIASRDLISNDDIYLNQYI